MQMAHELPTVYSLVSEKKSVCACVRTALKYNHTDKSPLVKPATVEQCINWLCEDKCQTAICARKKGSKRRMKKAAGFSQKYCTMTPAAKTQRQEYV
jgi:hypothetical protein